MQKWTQSDGYRVKAMQLGTVTIYIRRPVLPSQEYQQRERSVRNALEAYGRTIQK